MPFQKTRQQRADNYGGGKMVSGTVWKDSIMISKYHANLKCLQAACIDSDVDPLYSDL